MNKLFKSINLLALVILLTTFGCGNDDDGAPQNIEVNIENLTIAIDENPTNGQVIGTVETDGSGSLSFSITSQTPAGALSINTSTGELTVADAAIFDFEANPVITATVTVVDASSPATVTINLNNLNEATIQDLTVAIDENPTDGQVVGTFQTGGSATSNFSITSQTPAGALNIDATTGELTVADATLFDFETNPVITANITVDDAENAATVTINLNDVDEITVQNLITDIDENPTNGQVIGSIQANSAGNLSYTITFQSTAGALSVDQSTGELSVADYTLFDFETTPSMYVVISVDNGAYSVSANATIALNDLNEIGEYKYGGVIFWIDPASYNSGGGLVCAVSDQSTSASWGCSGISIAGTSASIGSGEGNTVAIETACPTVGTAAYLAVNYDATSFSDWFLPSRDELEELLNKKSIIDVTAAANSGTSIGTDYYWSSTETSSGTAALLLVSNSNVLIANGNKGVSLFGVRAIRTFSDL